MKRSARTEPRGSVSWPASTSQLGPPASVSSAARASRWAYRGDPIERHMSDCHRRVAAAAARAGLLDDPLGLALGLGQHLLALLHDPARLLDLLGDRRAHLVEDVVDLLLVHAHLVGQGDRLGVVDEIVQLVDEYENVHFGGS